MVHAGGIFDIVQTSFDSIFGALDISFFSHLFFFSEASFENRIEKINFEAKSTLKIKISLPVDVDVLAVPGLRPEMPWANHGVGQSGQKPKK